MRPFIRNKKVKGNTYYYLVEPVKVGRRWKYHQSYLGTALSIKEKLQQAGPRPVEAAHRSFADVAALWKIAQELNVAGLINQNLCQKKELIDVGNYLVLAAINRCVLPKSKNGIGSWYPKTVLPELMGLAIQRDSGKAFWEAMDCLDEAAISRIEEGLWQRLSQSYPFPPDVLFYDTTNFFTFFDELTPSELARRGHNKASRNSLRQVGLALAVTRGLGLPLLHKVYEGNLHDSRVFPTTIRELVGRFFRLSRGVGRITLVFDKGNNSQENLKQIDDLQGVFFIGSLVPSQHTDLLWKKPEDYPEELPLPPKAPPGTRATRAYRTQKVVFGKMRTLVVTYDEPLARKQRFSLERRLQAAKEALEKVSWAKVKSPEITRKEILRKYRLGEWLKVTVLDRADNRIKVTRNSKALAAQRRSFGKTILFTDREDLTTRGIISSYRGKNAVEESFKQIKDRTSISFSPLRHWTDQKIRVHAFICVLGLLLLRLAQLKAAQKGLKMSPSVLLQELADVRAIFLLDGANRVTKLLSSGSTVQKKLLAIYGLEEMAIKLGIMVPNP